MEVIKKKRIWLLVLLPVAWVTLILAKRNVFFAEEIMAKKVYRLLSVLMARLTGWLPFSLAECTVFAAPVLVLFFLIRFIVHMVKRKEKRFERSMLALINAGCVISVVYFVYVVGCGVNYHRASVAEYKGLTVQDSSKEESFLIAEENFCLFRSSNAR